MHRICIHHIYMCIIHRYTYHRYMHHLYTYHIHTSHRYMHHIYIGIYTRHASDPCIIDMGIIDSCITGTYIIDMCIMDVHCRPIYWRFILKIYASSFIYVWCSFSVTIPASWKYFFFCIFFSLFIFFSLDQFSFYHFSFVIFSFVMLSFFRLISTGYTQEQLCLVQPSRVGRRSFEMPRC